MLIYDIALDSKKNQFVLKHWKTVYTKFDESLQQMTRPEAGGDEDFIEFLQEKVDEKLENPPDTKTIDELF